MARNFRQQGFSKGYPKFFLKDQQLTRLIDKLKDMDLPFQNWSELVAPHCHHYKERTGQVAVQYPPGTGFILSLFPDGISVPLLNLFTILFFASLFSAVAILGYLRKSPALIVGGLFLWLTLFEIINFIGTRSFSINALLVPLIMGSILFSVSNLYLIPKFPKIGLSALGLSGALLGLSFLVRISVLFLIPGLFLYLLMTRKEQGFFYRALALSIGFALLGGIPLAIHQHIHAGAFYHTTYGSSDATLPLLSLKLFNKNFWTFFIDEGRVGIYSALVVCLIAAFAAYRSKLTDFKKLTWALSCAFLLHTLYIFTHEITVLYYQVPALLLAAGVSLGILIALSLKNKASATSKYYFSLLLALGFWMIWPAQKKVITESFKDRTEVLPEELASPDAWLWSNVLSGSFWYYNQKPSYKIPFVDPDIRDNIIRALARDKRNRQFLVVDSPVIANMLNGRGFKLEPSFEIYGAKVLEIIVEQN